MNAVIIAFPSGTKYRFGKDSIIIGRNKENDIVTNWTLGAAGRFENYSDFGSTQLTVRM